MQLDSKIIDYGGIQHCVIRWDKPTYPAAKSTDLPAKSTNPASTSTDQAAKSTVLPAKSTDLPAKINKSGLKTTDSAVKPGRFKLALSTINQWVKSITNIRGLHKSLFYHRLLIKSIYRLQSDEPLLFMNQRAVKVSMKNEVYPTVT
ncbi:hypothetical protein J6590_028731 [Homalodisca vitripennis]|nr:hypothetical protein J6590_028731 [Homalodisca vitripennis]